MAKKLVEIAKSVALAFIFVTLVITFVFEAASVDGMSMSPMLKDKDRIIIEKVSYYFHEPKIGDVIVFKYPADIREKFIKRVVAVGGDRVKIVNDKVYVNDILKDEFYLEQQEMEDYSEVTVPMDTVFVLGDNRNNSKDSRNEDVGFLSSKLILGRAAFRVFPLKELGRIK